MKKTIEERAREWSGFKDSHSSIESVCLKNGYIKGAHEQFDQDLTNACDAYCKVCGHFAHTVPNHICRQDCEYYTQFKTILLRQQ